MNESKESMPSVWQLPLLAKIFAAPVFLCLFFALAPKWQNAVYIDAIISGLEKSMDITSIQKQTIRAEFEKSDLEQVCEDAKGKPTDFSIPLVENGYCSGFDYLHIALWFSLLSFALLLINLILTYALSTQAEKSAAQLLLNYKLAWRLNLGSVLIQLFLQAPLLAFAIFEITVLLMNRYFPQLILMLIFAAGYAIYLCIRSLFEKIPMEFGEEFARQITRSEAPTLWTDIESAAKKLGAPAPENIVVGMSENFYVTELEVRTSKGVTQGRTLYLSYVLMKFLSPQEVMSIVCHELGHFHGEDTKSTREFYPFNYRVNQSLWILANTGWAAVAVRHMLMQFATSFKWPEQKLSRERELAADRFGARYLDHRQMAQALVKVNALSQAYQFSLQESPTSDPNLKDFYESKIVSNEEFWKDLSQFKTPHPLDSHPTLADRMRNLGIDPKPETLQELAKFSNGSSAFTTWFGTEENIFEEMRATWQQRLDATVLQRVDAATPAGKETLSARFPPLRWQAKTRRFWKSFVLFIAFGSLMLVAGFLVPKMVLKIIFSAFGLLSLYISYFFYRNHYQGVIELDHEGLSYSGLREKILFSDLSDISTQRISGTDYLIFHFKELRPRLLKFNLFKRPYKAEQIPISDFEVSAEEIVVKVSSYLLRR